MYDYFENNQKFKLLRIFRTEEEEYISRRFLAMGVSSSSIFTSCKKCMEELKKKLYRAELLC
jgi:hypothetical protein